MSRKNPKLLFIQSIAEQERRLDQEISSATKSAITTLQQHPKPYYSIQDVGALVDTLKSKMQSLNKEAHTEFSKRGLKGLDISTTSSDVDDDTTIISIDELEQLKAQVDEWREKARNSKHHEMRIEDLEILLSEKESEISDLKSQSGMVSGKVQDQIENLNLLQEELDEAKREAKQQKQDREKMEAEFETVGNALMATRLEIEELQQALGNKDIEMENLKSEVQILSSNAEENIRLKERKDQVEKEIETLYNDHNKKIEQYEASIQEKDKQYTSERNNLNKQIQDNLKMIEDSDQKISELEQENEDLLLDSGETSQEAVAIQNKLGKVQKALELKDDENRDLNIRLKKKEKEIKELSINVAGKKHDQEELSETLRNTNQELESRLEDLEIELRGKEERIQSIEKDRNELRETMANLKIEREKQKSSKVDLETQLTTKDRELLEVVKDLEALRTRQSEIAQEASDSRSKHAEMERQRDVYESKIKTFEEELEVSDISKKRLEKKLTEISAELEEKMIKIAELNDRNKSLDTITDDLKKAVETLRINLAKNPKYAILFVLQDIQQATIAELAKTVAIQQVFAERLMKELKDEGWVSVDETTGIVTLEKALLDLE
ncbi:MAG: hypothetical protein ACW97X_01380 [Candidatus Hodarchaeales archaeon]